MSFILDALKKSEERRLLREVGRMPKQTILDLGWSGARCRPLWLLLAVLPVALVFGWWLRGVSPQSSPEPRAAGQVAVVSPDKALPPVESPRAMAPEAGKATLPGEVGRAAPFAPVPAGSVVAPGQPATGVPRAVNGKPALQEIQPLDKAPAQTPPVAKPSPVADRAPAARQGHLPKLTMSLHFYTANPGQRMVRIDNHIVREGQSLSGNLVLEEITPSGAIFSYAGERFAVERPGGQP
jgi:general secretion pathway protein B